MFEYLNNAVTRVQKKFIGENMNPKLASAIIAYLIITPIDAILYLQWINTMTNYKWMAGGIIYPLGGLICFLVPTMLKLYKQTIRTEGYPKLQLAQIGCMDSIGGILSALTIPFISIMLNVIISKLSLPITMVASYTVLQKRYLWSHYLGVAVTIFGILTAAVPKLVEGSSTANPIAIIFLVVSLFFGVASNIIKEMYLKKRPDADSWYMNTIISLFQVGIGFITLPLVMLPIPGLEEKNLGTYISNALACQFGGVNSLEGDDCTYSLLYFLIFQLFGTAANILMFSIIREGSSVMFLMINTLKAPITALMGFVLIYNNVITYTKEESFVITWLDVVSLVVVVIGSIFYVLKPEIEHDYNQVDTEDGDKKRSLINPLIVRHSNDSNDSNDSDGQF